MSRLNVLNKKKLIILRIKQSIAKNKQKSDKEFLLAKINVDTSLLKSISKLKLRFMLR